MKMDNQGPKISVIVPVYNVEQYLPRCIDSILAQTFTDFELLLIDDGSTDKSGDICDEYARKDPRIRVFHKPNGGVSSARNMGLDNAKGEWIAFVDSDDWVNEDFLANFIEVDTGEDLLCQGFCSPNWKDEGSAIITRPDKKYHKDDIFNFILDMYDNTQLGYVWCKMFRRDVIEKNNILFIPEFSIREDMAFICKYCTCISSINNTSNIGYNYIYPTRTNKYNYQNMMDVCVYIYQNAIKTAIDDSKIGVFKDMYVGAAISALIETSKINNNHLSFFLDEFADYVKGCATTNRKTSLFKCLFIIRKKWYLLMLTMVIRHTYNIRNKLISNFH